MVPSVRQSAGNSHFVEPVPAADPGALSTLLGHGSRASRPSAGTKRIWQVVAILGFTIALVAHAAQLLVIGPEAVRSLGTLAPPRAFNAWIAESVCWGIAIAAVVLRRSEARLVQRWRAFTPIGKARLLGLSLAAVVATFGIGHWLTALRPATEVGWLKMFFMLASEYRPPAIFSALQLWLAAGFAFGCWRIGRQRAWLVTALLCAYMGADELLVLHESIGAAAAQSSVVASIMEALWVAGITVGRWEIVFAPLAVGLAAWLVWRFLHLLNVWELAELGIAGSLFLGGALGMEILEHRWAAGNRDFVNTEFGRLNVLIEEGLEMLGVTLAVLVFSRRWWLMRQGGVPAGVLRTALPSGETLA